MTRARFPLSSLYFRSSEEPLLSVVAMLMVCEVVPLLNPAIASGDRSWADMEAAREIVFSEFALSTTVGLREREILGESSGDPPYIDKVVPWERLKSFISFRYAIIERKARVYASLALSSSLRATKSTVSTAEFGRKLAAGSSISARLPAS